MRRDFSHFGFWRSRVYGWEREETSWFDSLNFLVLFAQAKRMKKKGLSFKKSRYGTYMYGYLFRSVYGFVC